MDDDDYTTDDDMDIDDDDGGIQIVMNVAMVLAAFNPVLANQLPPHQQVQLAQMLQQNQNQPVQDDVDDGWYWGR